MQSKTELTLVSRGDQAVPQTIYMTVLVIKNPVDPDVAALKDCFKALINKTLSKILDAKDFNIREELNKDSELEIEVTVRK